MAQLTLVASVGLACDSPNFDAIRDASRLVPSDAGGGACSCIAVGVSGDGNTARAAQFPVDKNVSATEWIAVEGRPFQRAGAILDLEGGTLQVLDAYQQRVLDTIQVDAASRPVDVARIGNKVYVAYADRGEIDVWQGDDRWESHTFVGTVDLSSVDSDGNPNVTSIAGIGSGDSARLVGALAMLDDATGEPRGVARAVIIDTATLAVVESVATHGLRPSSLLEITGRSSDELVFGTRDGADGETGCIEHLVREGTTMRLAECLATNQALGGVAISIADNGPGGGYWVVVETGPEQSNLVRVDRDLRISAPIQGAGEQPGEVAKCSLTKFTVYSDMASGTVRFYDEALDIMLSDDTGLSIGAPLVSSGAFHCQSAL